jgi:type I restriction enzyme S subunit
MTVQSLKYAEFEQHPFPFPPEKEQSRIVAKVDHLMDLCDELETKRNQRTETHIHLIRAAHHPLTQPRNHAQFQTAWRRIRDNSPRLRTISRLRRLGLRSIFPRKQR